MMGREVFDPARPPEARHVHRSGWGDFVPLRATRLTAAKQTLEKNQTNLARDREEMSAVASELRLAKAVTIPQLFFHVSLQNLAIST
jgi:hypothetical protein